MFPEPHPLSCVNSSPAPSRPRRSGVALLITLAVLTLIAIFLTEFSFETTLEVRALQNAQASFQSRNAVKSLFKAVLIGLQGGQDRKMSEVEFFEQITPLLQFAQGVQDGTGLSLNPEEAPKVSFLNPPELTVIPEELVQYALPDFYESFSSVMFYTPYIRPIDHLYNLNRAQTPNRTLEKEDRVAARLNNQFINIVTRYDAENSALAEADAMSIQARIIDWIDQGDAPFQSQFPGTSGNEVGLADPNLSYPVKNGFLESLREVLLLQLPRDRMPPLEFWEENFTTYPVGDALGAEQDPREVPARINVNLALQPEIEQFLSQFDQDSTDYLGYFPSEWRDDSGAEFFQSRERMAEALKASGTPLTRSEIASKVSGLVSTGRPDDYFIAESFWYEVRLKAGVGNVTSDVRAIVSVDRDQSGLVKADSLVVHEFHLR